MAERLKKLVRYILNRGFQDYQIFDTKNISGDYTKTIYDADGLVLDMCEDYEYLEVFGLTDEEKDCMRECIDLTRVEF